MRSFRGRLAQLGGLPGGEAGGPGRPGAEATRFGDGIGDSLGLSKDNKTGSP